MVLRHTTMTAFLAVAASLACAALAQAQAGAECFTATATLKTASGIHATAPLTVTIDRKMPQAQADELMAVFKSGGAAALREALAGAAPLGSVQLADGPVTPVRITIEHATDKGRFITLVTDKPLLYFGAGVPGAKAEDGYDFAVVDLEVNATGTGTGWLEPAARIGLNGDAFVIDDYAVERIRLAAVKKVK